MKTKFIVSLITALLFNALTSGAFASCLEVSHGAMFAVQTGLSLIPLNLSGCLAEGLNREIWIPEIIEKFYPSDSFLTHSKSLDAWVDNNKLNLQEAGVDPEVYIDNELYPIPIVTRTDIPHEHGTYQRYRDRGVCGKTPKRDRGAPQFTSAEVCPSGRLQLGTGRERRFHPGESRYRGKERPWLQSHDLRDGNGYGTGFR